MVFYQLFDKRSRRANASKFLTKCASMDSVVYLVTYFWNITDKRFKTLFSTSSSRQQGVDKGVRRRAHHASSTLTPSPSPLASSGRGEQICVWVTPQPDCLCFPAKFYDRRRVFLLTSCPSLSGCLVRHPVLVGLIDGCWDPLWFRVVARDSFRLGL